MAQTIFDTSVLGTNNNYITFNDDSSTIYYRLKSRQPQRRDIREYDIPLQENMGIADFQTFIGRTTYVLEGTMYPDDEDAFAQGRTALKKLASLSVEQADTASDQGYVPYKWTDNVAKQIFLKVLYVDLPESSKQGIKQPFRLFCKIKYPAIYTQNSTSVQIGSSSSSTSSASKYSFTYPIVFGASTYSSTGSLTNVGDLAIYPTSILITGPVNIPRLTNNTTGEYIEFSTNLASGSDTLLIQYDQDTISATKAGVSVMSSLTSASTFFKLKSGANSFTLSGSTMGNGANALITYMSAWPLS